MYASVTSTGNGSNGVTRKVHHYSRFPSNRDITYIYRQTLLMLPWLSRFKVNITTWRISKFSDNCEVSIVLCAVLQEGIARRRLRPLPGSYTLVTDVWNRLRGNAVAKTNKNMCYVLRVRKAAFPTKTHSSTNTERLKCTKLYENNFTFWTKSDKSGQEAEENFETLQR